MIIRTFGEIARMVAGKTVYGEESAVIRGVSKDTRTIQAGNLYVPIIGERFDGHEYAKEAYAKGAAATLWQRDRGEPPVGVPAILVDDALAALQQLASRYREQLPVRITGITGSNGKTTTKDMIAAVLAVKYNVHKTEGNLNGDIGLPLMILQMDERTELAVLEMGMRGFHEIELLTHIAKPEAAVITMIGEAHMEYLGSREGIAKAKLEILSGLKEDGMFAYLGDEPLLDRLLPHVRQPASMNVVRFGASAGNDLRPTGIEIDGDGTRFTVNGAEEPVFSIPLLGKHNVVNAMAAVAIGRYFGLTDAEIAAGLSSMKPTGMRIERLTGVSGVTVLNDAYNSSPASTLASLELLRDLTGFGRKLVVLGDMLELGENDVRYHAEIGATLSSEHFDCVLTYGPLSKHTADAAAPFFPEGKVRWFGDKEQLANVLAAYAKPDDIVLVKGSRGMRLEEVVHRLIEQQL
ncbi:UDP-N-acetylmuramoyl-tripeptide--D-alanyl-D-alanine ligase [Paenibacillus sp. GYB004]|uniref:UDP-N-acetylmuramoyl-tripeptide--D-alanyl-D- alanine ligase n=1 Tax=Paenibacillus sp. GYB004 TaxID=2994393 RepID=UPI002F96B1E3